MLVEDFQRRTEGRLMNLMTSDENPAYVEAILTSYGEEYQPRRKGKRGRRPWVKSSTLGSRFPRSEAGGARQVRGRAQLHRSCAR